MHWITAFLADIYILSVIASAERDGPRAETRIYLSPKRTSPFKSMGASVQSTTGSRGVRISSSNDSNAGQTTFRGKVELYWLPTPFACFPFTSPPVRRGVPAGSERALTLAIQSLSKLEDRNCSSNEEDQKKTEMIVSGTHARIG